jgi:hypothetical protein
MGVDSPSRAMYRFYLQWFAADHQVRGDLANSIRAPYSTVRIQSIFNTLRISGTHPLAALYI